MRIKVGLFLGVLIILNNCSLKKDLIPVSPRKLPESTSNLYAYSLNRNLPYNGLLIKNVTIRFKGGEQDFRLLGSIKMLKDEAILLSIRSPFGVELTRILYTRDSVKMLDRRNDRAFVVGYENFPDFLPVDFNFQMLQSVFTGNIPEGYRNVSIPEPKFTREVSEEEVYLGTYEAPDTTQFLNFYGWINNNTVRPSYFVFYSDEKSIRYNLSYLSYQQIAEHRLPKEVQISFNRNNEEQTLNLEMGRVSFESFSELHLNIPADYKMIRK